LIDAFRWRRLALRTRMPSRVIRSDAFSSFLKGRIARESSGI